jgi:hypothetical protein
VGSRSLVLLFVYRQTCEQSFGMFVRSSSVWLFFFQVATFQPGGSWSRSWKEVRQRKNRELACFPHVSVSGDEVSVP